MKKIFLFVFFTIAVCTITQAQDSTAKAKKGDLKQLNLSKDQKAKIKATNKDFKSKTDQVKADSTLTAAQRKAKIKELNKEKKQQTDTVLTTDQKAKLKQIKKDQKTNSPQNNKPSPKTAGATKR